MTASRARKAARLAVGPAAVVASRAPEALLPATDDSTPWPSPARGLRQGLEEEIQRLEWEAPTKWSPRRTLIFVTGVCGGFWLLTAAMALKLFH